jgi:uncharacterized protein
MVEQRRQEFVLGSRVTVFVLLREYPFLRDFLIARDVHFAPLRAEAAGWARVATLGQAAAAMDESWRDLARDICAEVERVTGRAPALEDASRPIALDDARVAALRAFVAELEDGGSLLELSRRYADVTRGLDRTQAAALERALGAAVAAERLSAASIVQSAPPASDVAEPPPGHPLETLEREGRQVRVLCDELRGTLQRLGGSPSRRRWHAARPLVTRLVDGVSGVELRFRRHRQAWFPALEVLGVEGPIAVLGDREAQVLDTLRRLRLAVKADDGASAVETGTLLLERLEDILSVEQEVLVPLAAQRFGTADWAAVRELEDGVGWSLVPEPPPWPGS